jgi:hypothetical protein
MKPLEKIPQELFPAFSMDGKIEIEKIYLDGTNSKERIYTKDLIDRFINEIRNKHSNYYGDTDLWLYDALEKYHVSGKNVVVFGSSSPWYESVAIFHGCDKCYVLEYNKITAENEKIIQISGKEKLDIDFGFSISSFEHYGLGRYGDPINPHADIEAMEEAKKIIKKNGLLFLAVPIGKDKVVWNANRIYGDIRLKALIFGWEIVDRFGWEEDKISIDTERNAGYQPVFVLKNK